MKAILIATSTAVLMTGTAFAADFAPAAPQGHNWTGPYIGIGGGAGAVVHDVDLLGGIASFDGIGGEGVFGELTIGYDYMLGQRFVIGAFADGRVGNIGPSLDVLGIGADLEGDYGFDVGLRLGYLVTPSTLAYVLGGYSWQHFDASVSGFGSVYDWSSDGFVVGAGMETFLAGNWTLKTEYRYAQYGGEDIIAGLGGPAGILELTPSTHTFHAGLNYRFGADSGGGAAFETPAYDWSGFKIGAAVGAGGLSHEVDLLGGLASFNGIGAEGVFGEVSIGYDWEFGGGWVAGVMADARYSTVSTELEALGFDVFSLGADYGFDVIGRVGKTFGGSTLVYALGGYSWQHFDVDVITLGSIYDWGASGFTVGGGIETALSERTTLNVEYRYSAYDGEDMLAGLGAPGVLELSPSSHTVRAGLKFKLF